MCARCDIDIFVAMRGAAIELQIFFKDREIIDIFGLGRTVW